MRIPRLVEKAKRRYQTAFIVMIKIVYSYRVFTIHVTSLPAMHCAGEPVGRLHVLQAPAATASQLCVNGVTSDMRESLRRGRLHVTVHYGRCSSTLRHSSFICNQTPLLCTSLTTTHPRLWSATSKLRHYIVSRSRNQTLSLCTPLTTSHPRVWTAISK